jgi:hypothetical protein
VLARGGDELAEDVGRERALRGDRAAKDGAEHPKTKENRAGEERLRAKEEAEPLAPGENGLVRLGSGDFRNRRTLGKKNLFFGRAHRSAAVSRIRGLRNE